MVVHIPLRFEDGASPEDGDKSSVVATPTVLDSARGSGRNIIKCAWQLARPFKKATPQGYLNAAAWMQL